MVLFFYIKLASTPLLDTTEIYATSQEIMDFCGISNRVYYNTLQKMLARGLLKKGLHHFDTKGFLDHMNARGTLYIVQNVFSTEATEK